MENDFSVDKMLNSKYGMGVRVDSSQGLLFSLIMRSPRGCREAQNRICVYAWPLDVARSHMPSDGSLPQQEHHRVVEPRPHYNSVSLPPQ